MLCGRPSWMSYHGNTYDGVGEARANWSLALVQLTGNSGKRLGNDSLKLCFCKAGVCWQRCVCVLLLLCTSVQYGAWRRTPNGFQPLFRKNGILSFSKMWRPLGLAESSGSIAKKMCFKIVLTYVVHIRVALKLHWTLRKQRKLRSFVGSNHEEVACASVGVGGCLCLHILSFPNLKSPHCLL